MDYIARRASRALLAESGLQSDGTSQCYVVCRRRRRRQTPWKPPPPPREQVLAHLKASMPVGLPYWDLKTRCEDGRPEPPRPRCPRARLDTKACVWTPC